MSYTRCRTLDAVHAMPLNRPHVIGIGDGSCELPAPTSELSKAIARAVEGPRKAGRVVKVMTIHEYRTTMCCCACGSGAGSGMLLQALSSLYNALPMLTPTLGGKLTRCEQAFFRIDAMYSVQQQDLLRTFRQDPDAALPCVRDQAREDRPAPSAEEDHANFAWATGALFTG